MQQIRNKLVVAFQIQITDVKTNHSVARFDPLPHDFNRLAVTIQQRLQVFRHDR
jgi:hypothetical protein